MILTYLLSSKGFDFKIDCFYVLSVCIFTTKLTFMIFVYIVRCNEGTTLLEIKKSFRDVDNVLYDWTDSPASDYCVWRGITCDNVTFNVVAL